MTEQSPKRGSAEMSLKKPAPSAETAQRKTNPDVSPSSGQQQTSAGPTKGEVVATTQSSPKAGGYGSRPASPPPTPQTWLAAFLADRNVRVATCFLVLVGLMHGATVGYVSAYLALHVEAADCNLRRSTEACDDASHANNCKWVLAAELQSIATSTPTAQNNAAASASSTASSGMSSSASLNETAAPTISGGPFVDRCMFDDYALVQCDQARFQTKDACRESSTTYDKCSWNERDDKCEHTLGWPAWKKGVFAAAHTVGGVIGPLSMSYLLSATSADGNNFRLLMLLTCGLLLSGIVCEVLARAFMVFPLLALGRFFFGTATAGNRFLGPLYAFRICPLPVAQQVAALVEPFTQTGFLIHALYALAVEPRGGAYDGDPNMELRIQFLHFPAFLLAGCVFALWIVARNPAPVVSQSGAASPKSVASPKAADAGNSNPNNVSNEPTVDGPMVIVEEEPPKVPLLSWTFARCLIIGMFTAAPYLLTGLGPLISFISSYGKDVYGVPNFVAPLLVCAVSIPAGLTGVAARKFFHARPMMLTGTLVSTIGLLLVALGAHPGIIPTPGRYVVACLGNVVFVGALQGCVCPTFFELALRIMPPELVSVGSSVLSMTLSLYSLITNVLFPILVQAFSGGPDGDQNEGYSYVSLLFAGISGIALLVLFLFMHPYDDGSHLLRGVETPSTEQGNAIEEEEGEEMPAATASDAKEY